MDVPVIDPYPMPGPDQLVESRVDWTADPERSALLVLNMQGFFLRPYTRGAPPLDALLANCSALLRTCRGLRVPVVHTVQPGTQAPGERGLLTDFWGKGLDDVLEDAAIVRELTPDASGAVLSAWRYSAFFGSGLARQLRELGRDQLVICGVYAHLSCVTTAVDAFSHNLEVFLAADAVADFSAHEHRAALAWAASCCAAVKPTGRLTAELLHASRAHGE
ncbi:isochorismatase family protein [Streptomyces phaeoluteigriseus]|uniref:Isochorismatase family protein n=1 Tax=Streptomyces phaeoluteigriseus TaxID=114686 RepID=A0ABY4ZA12_9ACTN|nr:isochorismatase family protein [Streptomyces phaeoluteigriseus]USQ85712.1 isochorismatase family protein [Streptomyces phaeoluteigriseus]